MGEIDGTAVAQGAPLRLVARLTTQYFLESARLFGELLPGDSLTTLIFLTILNRNLLKVSSEPGGLLAHARLDDPMPDERRTPVTVYAVAKELGLSYETVRRHVKRLLDAGFCRRCAEGLIAPSEITLRPEFARVATRNYANLQRLVRGLSAAGALSALT